MIRKLAVITLGINLFFLSSCEKKSIEVNKDIVDAIEEERPIVNYGRECEPKEMIRNTSTIEGYSDKQSYSAGETVFFYVHSRKPVYEMNLYRFGATQDLIHSDSYTNGTIQNYLCYAYSWGCDWAQSFKYNLPIGLKTGFYSAELKNDLGSFWVTFIIKNPIKSADIAVIASTNTWNAYNDWGGGSYYKNTIEAETATSENVSFQRPNRRGNLFSEGHLAGAELILIKWLENHSYSYDAFCDMDLHNIPDLIKAYKVIIIQVHPEYYTAEMFAAIKDYIDNGGRLMYLGANGIYAKVVHNPELDILEVRKKGTNHSYINTKGGLWRNLGQPESALTGVEYTHSGYNTYAPYKVNDSNHWIFNNTNLKNGDEFGGNCGRGGASGHETDKTTAYSPKNLKILAKGTNPDLGGAEMTYYEHFNGGKVFSVGSITYTSCINEDPVISTITENVLNEFLK